MLRFARRISPATTTTRAQAFLDIANDESYDAVWFARGGYGSCRVVEAVMGGLTAAVQDEKPTSATVMPACCLPLCTGLGSRRWRTVRWRRTSFERRETRRLVGRSLGWSIARRRALEPTVCRAQKTAAFNMTVLSQLLGTPLQPDLDGHVLMLEEVAEAMYRIDRSLFHITSNAEIRRVSGIMLGRCSDITPNEPDFGMNEEEVARYWCRRSGIPWLGRADIGHDVNNKIVPFGTA